MQSLLATPIDATTHAVLLRLNEASVRLTAIYILAVIPSRLSQESAFTELN